MFDNIEHLLITCVPAEALSPHTHPFCHFWYTSAGLPLLQPNHRHLLKRCFAAVGKALEAICSPLAKLRTALHLEVAKAEADADSFIKVVQNGSCGVSALLCLGCAVECTKACALQGFAPSVTLRNCAYALWFGLQQALCCCLMFASSIAA